MDNIRVNLVITHQCNLNCQYCVQKKDNSNFTIELAQKLFSLLKNFEPKDKLEFHFYGGEPLLFLDQIKKIVKFLLSIDKSFKFSITTNGTLLNDKVCDFLIQNEFIVYISLDGDLETQLINRNNSSKLDSYCNIRKYARKLVRNLKDIRVTMVINNKKLQNIVKNIFHINSLGFKKIFISPVCGIVWKKKEINNFKHELIYLLSKNDKLMKKNIIIDNLKNLQPEIQILHNNKLKGFSIDCDGSIYVGDGSEWSFKNKNDFYLSNINKYNKFRKIIQDACIRHKKNLLKRKKIIKKVLGKAYKSNRIINKLLFQYLSKIKNFEF